MHGEVITATEIAKELDMDEAELLEELEADEEMPLGRDIAGTRCFSAEEADEIVAALADGEVTDDDPDEDGEEETDD